MKNKNIKSISLWSGVLAAILLVAFIPRTYLVLDFIANRRVPEKYKQWTSKNLTWYLTRESGKVYFTSYSYRIYDAFHKKAHTFPGGIYPTADHQGAIIFSDDKRPATDWVLVECSLIVSNASDRIFTSDLFEIANLRTYETKGYDGHVKCYVDLYDMNKSNTVIGAQCTGEIVFQGKLKLDDLLSAKSIGLYIDWEDGV